MNYPFVIQKLDNERFQHLCTKFDNGVQGIVTEALLVELKNWMQHIPSNLVPDVWNLNIKKFTNKTYSSLENQFVQSNQLLYFGNYSIIQDLLNITKLFSFCLFETINWWNYPIQYDKNKQKAEITVQPNQQEVFKLVIVQTCNKEQMPIDYFDVQFLYWNAYNQQHVEIRPLDKYFYSSLCGEIHSFNNYPAYIIGNSFRWYKNGLLHRDGENVSSIVIKEVNNSNNFTFEFYKWGKLYRDSGKPSQITFSNNYQSGKKSVLYNFCYWNYTGFRLPLFQHIYQNQGFVRVCVFTGRRYFVAPTADIQDIMENVTNDIIHLGLIFRSLPLICQNQTVYKVMSNILHFLYLGFPDELLQHIIVLVLMSFSKVSNLQNINKIKRKQNEIVSDFGNNKRMRNQF